MPGRDGVSLPACCTAGNPWTLAGSPCSLWCWSVEAGRWLGGSAEPEKPQSMEGRGGCEGQARAGSRGQRMTLPTYLVAWGWSGLVGRVGRAGGGPRLGLWGCLCRRGTCWVHVGTDHAGICDKKDELVQLWNDRVREECPFLGSPLVVISEPGTCFTFSQKGVKAYKGEGRS